MTRAGSFIRNVAWNHAGKIFDFGLLYLVRVMIARTLGPDNDSLFALFSSLATIGVLLAALGTDWIVYKYLPGFSTRDERDALAALLRRTYILRVTTSLIVAAACMMMLRDPSWGRWGVLGPFAGWVALFIIGQNLTMLGTAVFTAMMRTRVVFAVTISARIVLAAMIAVLMWNGELTAGRAMTVSACAVLLSAGVYAFWIRRNFRGPRTALPVRTMAAYGAVLLSHDLLYLVLGRQSDVLMLAYWFPGSAQVSLYDNAWQIGLVVEHVVTVGLAGILFSMYVRLAMESRDALATAHYRVLQCIQLIFVPVAATVALIAPGMIGTLYGPQFVPAAELVRVYLLLDLVDVGLLGGGANNALLNTVGKERVVLWNRGGWGVINLAVNFMIIPRYGALAALIVSRLCNLSAASVEYAVVVRTIGGGYVKRTAVIVFGATALGIFVASLLPRASAFECALVATVSIAVIAGGYALAKLPVLSWAVHLFRGSNATEIG